MKTKNQRPFTEYIKWAVAFLGGVAADYLYVSGIGRGTLNTVATCLMVLLMFFCFDVYKKDIRNLLKLAFIVISALSGTIFSIECIFLVIFELIINKRNKGGKDGK